MSIPVPNFDAVWQIIPDSRLEEITRRAQNAFWEIVAGAFSDDVESGDFPSDLAYGFGTDCKKAVAWWLQLNHPKLKGQPCPERKRG